MAANLSQANAEKLKFVQAIVVIVTLPCLLGIGGWMALAIVEHESKIAVLQSEAKGRYTMSEAKRDQNEIEKAFVRVENSLNDHEGRIRILEKGGL